MLVLDAGRTLAAGPPAEIVASVPGTITVVSGPPADAAERRRAWRRADLAGVAAGRRPRVRAGDADLQDAVCVAALRRNCAAKRNCAPGGMAPMPEILAEAMQVRRVFGRFTAVDGVDLRSAPGRWSGCSVPTARARPR